MQANVWLLIAIVVVALVAVLWLLRSRYGSGSMPSRPEARDRPPVPEAAAAPTEPDPAPPPLPAVDAVAGPPDDLSKMKGVGPKLIAQLTTLGVTRYDQIAAWTEADIAAIDARLGTFKGRPTRDKWVEQAGYLAKGDVAGFEAKFGKL